MSRKYLVTGALPYANGYLHVGHIAGAYLPADIYVRYRRARGDDVLFVCGSDDNGVPITLTAMKEGKRPEDIVYHYNRAQRAAFDGLGIEFDIYGGTHSPEDVERHTWFAQHFFLTLFEKGYISKKRTKQLYDPKVDMFLPDRYVKGTCHHCGWPDALGDQCENCGRTTDPLLLKDPISVISGERPIIKETVHWFFELENFRSQLREWLSTKKDWRPVVLNFSSGILEQPLPARSITRDLEWGVPLPLDEEDAKGKVLYVWFDAPIGYVTFTARLCEQRFGEWRRYEEYWKSPDSQIIHFIGEDNIIFHTIIWPAMLMGEGTFQLPSYVVANCFLNIQFPGKEVEKISKSRGTAIWIHEYLEEYDPDPLRYYLTAIAPETQRTAFNFDDFVNRNNGELLADLGNFFHRTITFAHKYFNGKVPAVEELKDADKEQLALLEGLSGRVAENIESFSFRAALAEFMDAVRKANKYFDIKAPWRSRKENIGDCATAINTCIQTLRTFTTIMQPFLPFSAKKAAKMLNLEIPDCFQWEKASDRLPSGWQLNEPEVLFKKIELEDDKSDLIELASPKMDREDGNVDSGKDKENKKMEKEIITYEQFAALDLRVGKILDAKEHPNADKLLVLKVDLGRLGERQIVAGIKSFYKPEELIGKSIVVIVNLKPRVVRGIESQGMLLAASKGEGPEELVLLTTDKEIEPGSVIS